MPLVGRWWLCKGSKKANWNKTVAVHLTPQTDKVQSAGPYRGGLVCRSQLTVSLMARFYRSPHCINSTLLGRSEHRADVAVRSKMDPEQTSPRCELLAPRAIQAPAKASLHQETVDLNCATRQLYLS